MNKCSKCGEMAYARLVIFTETTFGHGESFHKTYVKCTNCGNKSKEFGYYNWFRDEDLRKAQDSWNEENKSIH